MNKSLIFLLSVLGVTFGVLGLTARRNSQPHRIANKSSRIVSQSPRIVSIKWGEIQVSDNNKICTYRDAKLSPEKSRAWDWNKTGTRHVPGIQIADIQEFIDEVDVVVLTRGMDLVLQVPQETIDYVKSKGKECHVGQTEDMVRKYNELVKKGKKVGGVFHSTC